MARHASSHSADKHKPVASISSSLVGSSVKVSNHNKQVRQREKRAHHFVIFIQCSRLALSVSFDLTYHHRYHETPPSRRVLVTTSLTLLLHSILLCWPNSMYFYIQNDINNHPHGAEVCYQRALLKGSSPPSIVKGLELWTRPRVSGSCCPHHPQSHWPPCHLHTLVLQRAQQLLTKGRRCLEPLKP